MYLQSIVCIVALTVTPVVLSRASNLQFQVKSKATEKIYFDVKTTGLLSKKNIGVSPNKSKTYVLPSPFERIKKVTFTKGSKGGKKLQFTNKSEYRVDDEKVYAYNRGQFDYPEDEITKYWKDAK